MGDSPGVLATALDLLVHIDSDLVDIILLSLRVTLTAVAFAALLGIPLGALLAVSRFPGRGFLVLVFHTLMGLPPVVVGLAVYLLLSRAGPLGGSRPSTPRSRTRLPEIQPGGRSSPRACSTHCWAVRFSSAAVRPCGSRAGPMCTSTVPGLLHSPFGHTWPALCATGNTGTPKRHATCTAPACQGT